MARITYKTQVRIGARPGPSFTGKMSVDNYTAGQKKQSDEIATALIEATPAWHDADTQRFLENVKVARNALQKAADDEAARIGIFIERMFFRQTDHGHGLDMKGHHLWNAAQRHGASAGTGRTSAAPWSPVRPIGGGVLNWSPLSAVWKKRKGNNQFFVHKGHLRSFMHEHGKTIFNEALGGVRVVIDRTQVKELRRGTSRKRVVASLRTYILPKANPSNFPGLSSGDWSQYGPPGNLSRALAGWGVYDETVREKLTGLRKRRRKGAGVRATDYPFYRPMLPPAIQFWALHRIPAALARATREARYNMSRDRRKAMGAMSRFNRANARINN